MKHFNNSNTTFIYDYLIDNYYFNEEELELITKAFGDNIDTYNTICYVRYGLDFDQIFDNDFHHYYGSK